MSKSNNSFQEEEGKKGFTIENCNNGILIVKLNRPHRKNALKLATYGHLAEGKDPFWRENCYSLKVSGVPTSFRQEFGKKSLNVAKSEKTRESLFTF